VRRETHHARSTPRGRRASCPPPPVHSSPREDLPRFPAPMLCATGLPKCDRRLGAPGQVRRHPRPAALGAGGLDAADQACQRPTNRFPELKAVHAELGHRRTLLDGEVVVFDDQGRPTSPPYATVLTGTPSTAGDRPTIFVVWELLLPTRRKRAGRHSCERQGRGCSTGWVRGSGRGAASPRASRHFRVS
jgi:hypothetical protein